MTKNKSLFSGVGDGNRVKSIRLQGDKHTQGKKGKRTVSPASWVQTNSTTTCWVWQLEPGLWTWLGGRRVTGEVSVLTKLFLRDKPC